MITAVQLDTASAQRRPVTRIAEARTTLAEAYAVQREFVALRARRIGASVAGYKVAFTRPESRAAVGAPEYASGVLLEPDVRPSGTTVHLAQRFAPVVEAELAFRVLAPLDGTATLTDVVERTEVAAAIEVPDSRIAGWFAGGEPTLTLAEAVSDDCLVGLLVVGERWTPTAAVDLAHLGVTLHVGDRIVRRGGIDLVVPGPVEVLLWLAHQLGRRGERLVEGQTVTSGTWTEAAPLEVGRYRAEFDGVGSVAMDVE